MNATKTGAIVLVWQVAMVASAQSVQLLTPTNTTWRYFTNGTDPGAGWALPGFDDSAWPQGRGLFGTETANVYPYEFATVIPLPRDGGPLTSYFRTHFPWNGGPFGVVLSGTNHVDDGCVVYLNGVEITRFNMPAGVPEYSTLAPVANPGGFPNLSGGEPVRVKMEIPLDNLTNGNANPLVNGDNVLAVEVHNQAFGSSDVVFGLSLFGGQCVAPCTDGIQPTNRTILEGRSTTFIVDLSENCGFPTPTFQWYRNVGSGEELIPGATASTYTLTNVMYLVDEGIYYCRLTRLGACSGTVYSRQAVLTILPNQPVPLLGATNTTWKYLADGTDQQTAWRERLFNDSAWSEGRGLFGNDSGYPYPFNTLIPGPSQGGPITVYFRTHFTWNASPSGVFLAGTNFIDDGNVIYLNGVEIYRFAMPDGPPAFDTRASPPIGGGGEPWIIPMQVQLDALPSGAPNPLRVGDNVLAVEVHQVAATSVDVVFGLSLFGRTCFPPCTDFIQPTNRSVLAGRSTTFVVNTGDNCGIPPPAFQWYRNVGAGEELIPGATASSFTLTNAQEFVDEGVYYCRLTSFCGSVDSRQALVDVFHYDTSPQFISASITGPGLNKFRLTTDHELCMDINTCGGDFRSGFNWRIVQSDTPATDLTVISVVMINPTTYEFTTELPRQPAKSYLIMVAPGFGEISDVSGNFVPPGTFAETPLTLTFQQGDASGYAGTHDAEIHSGARVGTPLGALASMKADLDDAGIAQSLLRFDSIIGFSPGQIPPGVRIRLATLTLQQIDPGVAVNLHRMLVPWDQTTVTWNSLTEGITADDVEARTATDATNPARTTNGPVELDVTSSVQVWANGQPNHGWALLSTGIDGWTVNTSESGASTAPLLFVELGPIEECNPVITRQPPPTLVIIEGQSVSISAEVLNPFGLVFQWTKDGVEIPGATSPAYSIQNARLMDSGTYRLRIVCESNPSTSVISSPTVVTVLGDDSRVHLTGSVAHVDGTRVTLRFSKPLLEATARNPANYQFAPPLAVLDVAHTNQTSSASVTLTTAPGELGANYVLRIANLRDTRSAGNLIEPNPTIVPLTSARVILPWNADGWLYNTNNLDATPDWKNPNFTPGPDWRTGCGLFGGSAGIGPLIPEPGFICTPLLPNNVPAESELRVTTYFRRTVELPVLPAGTRYVICHYADDGFIAYLDGAEIYRFAMPADAVTFTNRSTGIPTGNATLRSFAFNATPGLHTLAVELHQAGVTSRDVVFGMEVRMIDGASPVLSITPLFFGYVGLNWDSDSSWRLRGAPALTGPFLDVAIPIGSRLGTFVLPAASVTNDFFWLLDYVCQP